MSWQMFALAWLGLGLATAAPIGYVLGAMSKTDEPVPPLTEYPDYAVERESLDAGLWK